MNKLLVIERERCSTIEMQIERVLYCENTGGLISLPFSAELIFCFLDSAYVFS